MKVRHITGILGTVIVSMLAPMGVCAAPAPPNDAYARIEGERCVLGNAAIRRTISLSGGTVRSVAIANELAHREIPIEGAEFALTVNDKQTVTAADFALHGKEVQDLDRGAKRLVLTLVHPKLGIEAQIRYTVAPGDPVLRKVLAVRAVGPTKPLLNRIDVERFFCSDPCELGGLGQPIFVGGSMFTGLEYPAAHNEAKDNARAKPPEPRFSVALWHLPGKQLTEQFLE